MRRPSLHGWRKIWWWWWCLWRSEWWWRFRAARWRREHDGQHGDRYQAQRLKQFVVCKHSAAVCNVASKRMLRHNSVAAQACLEVGDGARLRVDAHRSCFYAASRILEGEREARRRHCAGVTNEENLNQVLKNPVGGAYLNASKPTINKKPNATSSR